MRLLVAESDHLGDGPIWDDSLRRLLWIDIIGKRLSSCAPDGSALKRRPLPETPGSLALRTGGGMLLGFRRRLALLDSQGNESASLIPPEADMSRERFNDGACDARGRFWVGSMDRYLREPVGGLYRIDTDLTAKRMDTGLGISNGIAWSPGYKQLYHCDSLFPKIYVHDFDLETGTIRNRRLFAEFTPVMGIPDGCATDTRGFLWVAAPGAGCIFRFGPRGRLADRVPTPTLWPTSVAFGGSDACTLFITSREPPEGPPHPEDGSVFALQVDTPGMRRERFAG